MSGSPFTNAASVATVHGNQRLEPSDTWPYMRTALPMAVSTSGTSLPRASIKPNAPNVPFMFSEQTSLMSQMQGVGGNGQAASAASADDGANAVASLDDDVRAASTSQLPRSSANSRASAQSGSTGNRFSFSSAMNSEEVPKLILFAGAAAGAVLLLDLGARFLVNMATHRTK